MWCFTSLCFCSHAGKAINTSVGVCVWGCLMECVWTINPLRLSIKMARMKYCFSSPVRACGCCSNEVCLCAGWVSLGGGRRLMRRRKAASRLFTYSLALLLLFFFLSPTPHITCISASHWNQWEDISQAASQINSTKVQFSVFRQRHWRNLLFLLFCSLIFWHFVVIVQALPTFSKPYDGTPHSHLEHLAGTFIWGM